jgi:hypothetical protein
MHSQWPSWKYFFLLGGELSRKGGRVGGGALTWIRGELNEDASEGKYMSKIEFFFHFNPFRLIFQKLFRDRC